VFDAGSTHSFQNSFIKGTYNSVKPWKNLKCGSLIRINSDWIDRFLLTHNPSSDKKIKVRCYSLRFAGTQEHMAGLVKFMAESIEPFVYSKAEIEELVKKGRKPWKEAAKYFGYVDPLKDGKCGELFLFLLVEAVLKAPMIAHKIKYVSDEYNDPVKGSDGVFFGQYNEENALLFGEAKIYQSRSDAISSALKSVNNFYEKSTGYKEMDNELCAIREKLTRDLTTPQLQYLENVLDTQSDEHRNVIKVHPIVIVYDNKRISDIEEACKNANDGERRACQELAGVTSELLTSLSQRLIKEFQQLKIINLDFFFIPVSDVNQLREAFFVEIHSMPYPRKDENR
jgi:hypothetical protein